MEVLEAIDPFVQAESTGTAMLVFSDNSLGRIYLNEGVPTSARYKNLEGMDALERCKTTDVVTVKFHENTDIVRSREVLRSNYEVMESLNNTQADRTVTEPEDSVVVSSSNQLSSDARQRLGALLADYIGPVAPLVMSDVPGNVDVESALSIVSREIDDTRRAAEFVAAARQIL